jgi:phenylalanine-4-hydroxylase
MRTDYRIDDFQQTYFVIESYEQLFRATVDTDFAPIYDRLKGRFSHAPEDVLDADQVISRGSQAYANAGGRFAETDR